MRREGEEKEAKMIGLTPYPVLCRPSRATLCHESFVISSIRCLTSASDMPVAMAIISTDAPDANNLRGHGDRYIGSLFRVDEPVPDDSSRLLDPYRVVDAVTGRQRYNERGCSGLISGAPSLVACRL